MGWRGLVFGGLTWLVTVAVFCGTGSAADVSLIAETPDEAPIILVSGELKDGDDKAFANIALPLDKALVVFDSPGGNLLAGIGIGKAIRLKEFWTAVGEKGMCASACGLAWLGGIKRLAEPGARIGFHAAYVTRDGDNRESGSGNALVGAYLNQLGMSQTAIVYLTSAPPDDMEWLPLSEAQRYGIELEIVGNETLEQPASRTSPPGQTNNVPGNSPLKRLDGYDILGFDLEGMPIRNVSRDQCESACLSKSSCMAYTFNIARNSCFLKSGGDRMLNNSTAVAGFRAEMEGRLFVSPITIVEKTDFPGNDIRKLEIAEFDQCLSACERDPSCKAFTFVKRKSVCWIKGAAGSPATNKRAVSGVRMK